MHVTLDQARALDAFARTGTYQAAAKELRKVHTAVLYALKQLEAQTGLELFDRSGYRTRLTPAGTRVLEKARALLEAERALEATCHELQSGWEPVLRVVVDAIFPLAPVLEVVRRLRVQRAPTRVFVSVDSLGAVEQRFEAERATAMVTVLPPTLPGLTTRPLPRLQARLVAHRAHPLAKRRKVSTADLAGEVLVTVRGSDVRLQLATRALDQQSTVHLPDFHSKKAAILAGLGFGWLPDWLITDELARGALVALPLEGGAVHAFSPTLALRDAPGPATQELVDLVARRPT
ncbi:MAG: LysR family transcriptional regulator [Myxococcaceae bacterium]|jgi:DNA-binding transcriptional LysR family regulator|nr:LysR family transcriptional regulator [Myxococcaceae bacterium]MCA3015893.1 LysR family transcriptional regulator [Myxococcaceae bacterium]